jgi:hypothetical protein
MNRQETITALCALVTEVGSVIYKDEVPHDCFCAEENARWFDRVGDSGGTVHPRRGNREGGA